MMLNIGLGAVLPEFQDAANALLAAAHAAGYTASLSVSGNNPVLKLEGQNIMINRTTLDEIGRYGITPADWVRAKVTGQAPALSDVARAVSQAEQLAALISAGRGAASGGEQVQKNVNQLLAFWEAQGTPYNPALVDVSRLNPEQGGWVPTLAETQFYSPAREARNLSLYQNTHPPAAAPPATLPPVTATPPASAPPSVVASVVETALNPSLPPEPSVLPNLNPPPANTPPSTVSSVVESILKNVGAQDLVPAHGQVGVEHDATLDAIPTWAWIAGAAAIGWFVFKGK